jgi:hypothetical protein
MDSAILQHTALTFVQDAMVQQIALSCTDTNLGIAHIKSHAKQCMVIMILKKNDDNITI